MHALPFIATLGFLLYATISLNAQRNLDYLGYLPYSQTLSDVWGYVAADGHEYALVGALDGVSVVDVQDPALPVELAFLPGAESIWRDLKVWQQYAYVTNETGGGLAILDLSNLPFSVDTFSYRERDLWSAHNLFIDSSGIAYICGANIDGGGVTMLDLSSNPLEPVFVGAYSDRYVHDVYVRGDTMWTADIQIGEFSVIDISDKSNPVVLASQSTPFGLTHNCWLSEDGASLAVTEEYFAGHILTYDVSDLSDIRELGRFRSNWESNVIPHNVFYRGNWLVSSYYRDGVFLTDATRPQNLVGTGFFDTSPFPSDGAFNGCWGVYPYLPSGRILATDIEEGLFILEPSYKRASYLEGRVTDTMRSLPKIYAQVEIMGTNARPYITGLDGEYRTGTVDSGLFTIRVTASGCQTALFPNVLLQPGQVRLLDVDLFCSSTGVEEPPEAQQVQFKAFPSVFQRQFWVNWEMPFAMQNNVNAELLVFNSAGQMMERRVLESTAGQLELGAKWPAGSYLLSLSDGLNKRLAKVIKY